jgi:hypothetical protein
MDSSSTLKQAAVTFMERGWKVGTVVHDVDGNLYRLAKPPRTVRNLIKVDVAPLFGTDVVTGNIGDFRVLRIECKCGNVSLAKVSNAAEPALSCSSCRRRYKRVNSGWVSGGVAVTLLPTPMIGMKVWLEGREGVITEIENINFWVRFEFLHLKESHRLYRRVKGGEHWSCRRKRAWLIRKEWNG